MRKYDTSGTVVWTRQFGTANFDGAVAVAANAAGVHVVGYSGAAPGQAGDVFLGSYASVYAGLPGPRGGVLPALPAGIEIRTGAEAGLADLSTGLGFAPRYSFTECGFGLQVFLVGFDLGVDPMELLDFATGFFLFDPRDDDI